MSNETTDDDDGGGICSECGFHADTLTSSGQCLSCRSTADMCYGVLHSRNVELEAGTYTGPGGP